MKRVVVIGGGVIGAACAHYLARAGWSVTLLERGTFGGAASHGNCGLICPSHVLPIAEPGAVGRTLAALFQRNSPFSIKPRLDPALWSWLLDFALRCNQRDMLAAAQGIQAILNSSFSLYEDLVEHAGIRCEWRYQGLLHVYRDHSQFEAYAATARLLESRFRCPAERLDAARLTAREPALREGLAGGWYYDHDAHLRPDVLLDSWKHALEKQGVTIHERTEFQGFTAGTNRANAALTATNEFPADAFVAALGAWSPKWQRALGCSIPIQPGKGYSLTMPRPAVCPKVPLMFPETRVVVTPFDSGYRIGSTMEFAGYDDSVPERRIQLLRDGARPYLREPEAEPIQERWSGWRPMTTDSLPIIDFSPTYANVLIATGHSMLGLSMAPATGKLAAQLLSGERPHLDIAPYRVQRFG